MGTASAVGGEVRWQFRAGDAVEAAPTVVGGWVFVGSVDGTVYAIDAASGREQWSFRTGGPVRGAPLVVDGTVYVGSEDETVYALDATTGRPVWSVELRDEVVLSPIAVDDLVYVQTDAVTEEVIAFDPASGEELRRHETDGFSWAMTVTDGTIYMGAEVKDITAYDATSGERVWRYETGNSVLSAPTVADGAVVAGSKDGFCYAVERSDGNLRWRHDTPDSITSSPTAADGVVYIGDDSGHLFALDADTGNGIWGVRLSYTTESSPTIAGSRVYCGSDRGIHGVDAETGEFRLDHETESEVHSSPTVADGGVYVGTQGGSVVAIATGEDASSHGSRVGFGAMGHTDELRTANATRHGGPSPAETGESEETDADVAVDIEHLRLVQTVEHTRSIDPEGRRDGVGLNAPVADELVLDESSDDIAWTASTPPLVDGRRLAPVFDLAPDGEDAAAEPVTVRGRLVRDGDPILERTATIEPAALQGQDEDRRLELEAGYHLTVPDRLPLLEMLAEHPDLVDGDYPTFPAASGHDLELEVDGTALEEPVTERVSIDDREVATTDSLTIGFVGLEKAAITDAGSYRFDGPPDIVGFAERSAQYILDTYPVTEVTVVALPSPVVGPSANFKIAPRRAANIATRKLSARIDGARTVRLTNGGGRIDDVDVSAVDVTVGVVPREEFFEGWGLDPGLRGLLPVDDGRPEADAVLAEIGAETVPAHELVHYFLGYFYEHPHVESADGTQHASEQLRSSGFIHRDGTFEVSPAQQSMMTTGGADWMDAHTYRGLVESDFQPFSPTESRSPVSVLGFVAKTDDHLGRVKRGLDVADAATLRGTDVDTDGLRDAVVDLRSSLGEALAGTTRYWEAPEPLPASTWERLADFGASVTSLGEALVVAENRYLADAETTTRALGGQFRATGRSLSTRADTRLETGVRTVMEVTGSLDADLDLAFEPIPVVGRIDSGGDDGRIEVRDADDSVLASAGLTTTQSVIGAGGGRTRVEGAVAGTVELPAEAATVVVEAATDESAVSAEIDATTGPIRAEIEALPDRAFTSSAARADALDRLDTLSERVAAGDLESAIEELQTLYRDLDAEILAEYERRSSEDPSKERVLASVGQQIQRLGGTVPDGDRGNPFLALLAGASAALGVGGYALKRHREVNRERPSDAD